MADYPGKNQSLAQSAQDGFNAATAGKKKKPQDDSEEPSMAAQMLADAGSGLADMAGSAAEALGFGKKKK